MTDSVDSTTSIITQHQRLVVLDKLTIDLIDRMNNSVALTAQTTKALQERIEALPNLLIQLISILTQNRSGETSVNAVSIWLNKVARAQQALSKKTSSQVSITQLCECEDELLNWLTEQGLQKHTELLQVLLELGVRRYDLEELEQTIGNTQPLHNLWLFMEFMLVTITMVKEINSELKHISTLVEAVNTLKLLQLH